MLYCINNMMWVNNFFEVLFYLSRRDITLLTVDFNLLTMILHNISPAGTTH
jgi:hypothetical protein